MPASSMMRASIHGLIESGAARQLPEVHTQLLRQLEHPERKKSHHRRLDARRRQRIEIAIPIARLQRRGEHGRRRHFDVDEVIGLRAAVERRIEAALGAVLPPIGLGIQIAELLRRVPEKRRSRRRQLRAPQPRR